MFLSDPNAAPHRVRLVPLTPRDEAEAAALPGLVAGLREMAAADDHVVLSPTHLMKCGGEVTGYASLGALPCVHTWFDSRHGHAMASLRQIETIEALLNDKGVPQFTVAVAETSPFSRHMARLGYTCLGTTQIWIKKLDR